MATIAAPAPAHDLAYYDALANRVLTTKVSRADLAAGLSQAAAGWKSLGINVSTDQYLADYLARNSSMLAAAHFELTPTEYDWLHPWQRFGSIQQIKDYQAFDRAHPTLPVQQQGMSPALVHDVTLGISAIPVVGGIASTAVSVAEAALSPSGPAAILSAGPALDGGVEVNVGIAEPAPPPDQAAAGSGTGIFLLLLLLALAGD
jgi:hypothetical protein